MALTKKFNAEGGTNGVAVTTANSGGTSGDAFNVMSSPGGSITYDSTAAVNGALGITFVAASGSQSIARHNGFAALTGVCRFYVKAITLPASSEAILSVCTATDGQILQVQVSPSGQYVLLNAAFGFVANTTNTFLASDRIELSWTIATATTGAYVLKLFRGNSTTATETLTGSTANFGTANWGYAQYGKNSTSTYTGAIKLDGLYAQDTTTTLPGPEVTTPTAVIDAPVTNAKPWSTVTHSGSGSNGGTINGYTWTQIGGTPVTLTGASTATVSYQAPQTRTGTNVVLQLVVTNTSGGTSTAATVTDSIEAVNDWAVMGGVEVPMRVMSV